MINDRDVDLHVARQLRILRRTMGMSQQDVGEAVGVTSQQVQKYENGTNRIYAGRLLQLSVAFNVNIGALFPERLDYQRHYEPIPPASIRLIRLINMINPAHYGELFTVMKALAKISTGKEEA
jgi:transcriptional regulator with XRE-family HTH domain